MKQAYDLIGDIHGHADELITLHEGEYLRPHTTKNIKQHQAFLNEFESEPELKQHVLLDTTGSMVNPHH